MIPMITGTNSVGSFLENADQNIIKIVSALETMNSSDIIPELRGMNFLDTFVRKIEGTAGHTEGFAEYNVYASDDGSYADANTWKESYTKWTFNRRGYVVKDKDFTKDLIREAQEKKQDLTPIVEKRIKAIADMYLNKYLPNRTYETLFVVPEKGGEYTSKPEGFLRDVEIDPTYLKVGSQSEKYLKRNHYRAIADATMGITTDDIEDIVEFLSEYRDINDANIIAIASRRSIYKLKSTLKYDGNVDKFMRTGQIADPICGVLFLTNEYMPKDWILFLDGQASGLITKLISPIPEFRGMAIEKDAGFERVENIHDLVGSFFRIQPEGYHLTGRHKGCFLYIGKDNTATEDPSKVRHTKIASDAQLSLLSAHAYELQQAWYKGLR